MYAVFDLEVIALDKPIIGSRIAARYAIELSLTENRIEEITLRKELLLKNIKCVACDFGGDFISGMSKIIERSVVAAKREEVISACHVEEGAVAGATREALSQLSTKAMGMSVGGKIGIARYSDHVAVAIFLSIGLGHLNEVCIGLGHRAL